MSCSRVGLDFSSSSYSYIPLDLVPVISTTKFTCEAEKWVYEI